MFPAFSVEAQAPVVQCYTLILLATVVKAKQSVISGSSVGPVLPGAVRCSYHTHATDVCDSVVGL